MFNRSVAERPDRSSSRAASGRKARGPSKNAKVVTSRDRSALPRRSSYTERVPRACSPGVSGPDQTRSGVEAPPDTSSKARSHEALSCGDAPRCSCSRSARLIGSASTPPARAARTASSRYGGASSPASRALSSRRRRCDGSASSVRLTVSGRKPPPHCRSPEQPTRGPDTRSAFRTRSPLRVCTRDTPRRGDAAPPDPPARARNRQGRWSTSRPSAECASSVSPCDAPVERGRRVSPRHPGRRCTTGVRNFHPQHRSARGSNLPDSRNQAREIGSRGGTACEAGCTALPDTRSPCSAPDTNAHGHHAGM